MMITFTPEQEAGLSALVAAGGFASIEDAARALLDERLAERALEDDGFAWTTPFVDQGLAALERGEFISLEEHEARIAARLAALRG
jgi:antitoxin ParD1/3/4